MKLSIEFNTDNAAFHPFEGDGSNAYQAEPEISRILIIVVDQLVNGTTEAPIRDSNGNTIGQWSWS